MRDVAAAIIWCICLLALLVGAVFCLMHGHPAFAVLLVICAGTFKVQIGDGSCE